MTYIYVHVIPLLFYSITQTSSFMRKREEERKTEEERKEGEEKEEEGGEKRPTDSRCGGFHKNICLSLKTCHRVQFIRHNHVKCFVLSR